MNRKEKASFLFEELGNVDDELLYESSGKPLSDIAVKQKKKKKARTLALLLAASVGFSLVMITVSYRAGRVDQDIDPTPTYSASRPEEHALTPDNEREVLFSGDPAIILEEKDGGRYYYKIDRASLASLAEQTEKNDEAVPPDTQQTKKVWITDGNGYVFSPCLRFTRGNIGFGTLFDYEDELQLSSEQRAALRRLTGGAY